MRSGFAKTDVHARQYCAFRYVYIMYMLEYVMRGGSSMHVYARTHVHMHYVRTYTRTHARTHVYWRIRTYACILHAHTHVRITHKRTHIYTVSMHTHVHVYVGHAHTVACTRVYIPCVRLEFAWTRCTRVYTYTHIHCNFRSACVALAHFSHHEQAQAALGSIVRRLGDMAAVGAIVRGGS